MWNTTEWTHSNSSQIQDSNLENVEEWEQQVEETVASKDDAESIAYEYDNDNNDNVKEGNQQNKKQTKKKTEKEISKHRSNRKPLGKLNVVGAYPA